MKFSTSAVAGLLRTAMVVCGLMSLAVAHADQGRYTVSADGQEVTDTQTKLVWQRCAYGQKWDGKTCAGKPTLVTLVQAREIATTAGAQWRIPTKEELVSLVEKSKKKPLINKEAFPDTKAKIFWATRPEKNDTLNAWLVNFSNGKVYGNARKAKYQLRLARSA